MFVTAKKRTRKSVRPVLDVLEARELLSTLTVTSAGDSGPGTLRDTIAAAVSGDTIDFDSSLNGSTITVTTGPIISVGKSLTLAGPGANNLTLSGGDTSAILVLVNSLDGSGPAIDVAISGLTLAHGNSSASGGAMFTNHANLSLTSDVFRDNVSAGQGGAFDAEVPFSGPFPNGTVTITDTQFVHNTASGPGGAFHALGLNTNVDGSTFVNNTSTTFAGGAFVNAAALAITNSEFIDNTGGAVTHFGLFGPGTDLSVSGSLFDGNVSTSSFGGAIYNDSLNASYVDSVFTNNANLNTSFGEGGAIHNAGSVVISGSQFEGNRVEGPGAASGGAVFLFNSDSIVVTNSSFENNLARASGAEGGAIDIQRFSFQTSPVSITLSGDTFTGNTAESRQGNFGLASPFGGAIAINNVAANVSITDGLFQDNQAIGGDGGAGFGATAFGGAISYGSGSFVPSSLTVTNTQFANNAALGGHGNSGGGTAIGGAVYGLFGLSSISFTNDQFKGNSAVSGDGGANSALGGAITNFGVPATIDNTVFLQNEVRGGDGAAGLPGGSVLGGAIYGSASITNTLFNKNTATGGTGGAAIGSGIAGRGGDADGGAIFGGDLTISSSQFLHNSATGGNGGAGGATGTGGAGGSGRGGAFAIYFGTVSITDTLFVQNEAIAGVGGAGATAGANGQGLGGAIGIFGGTVTIKRSKFNKNKATTAGDDIYGPYTP